MEPCDLDATHARALIGRRALSPVQLVESCIGRIEKTNGTVNALVDMDLDGARAAARAAEAAVMAGAPLGPLHGLPLGVKDMVDAAGLRTTYGSPLFADNRAKVDERLVSLLRQAGAIVIGKTNVPEWSAGGNTVNEVFGPTRNPFDLAKTVSGSSGGSAAALACGMVSLATGSDTGGSLRNPAAYCGVVGFRPTPGLVASEKRAMAWMQLSTLGPMARSVADVGLMLSVIAGFDARDPLSSLVDGALDASRFAIPDRVDLSGLRVAATTDFGFAPTEAAIAALFGGRADGLAGLFHQLHWTHPDCSGTDEAFAVLRAVLFLGRHLELLEADPESIGPHVRANVEEGLAYSARDVARALDLQTRIQRRWHAFFQSHDLILSPAVTVSPRPWKEPYPAQIDGRPTRSYFHWLALAYAATLAGHPAVVIPCGLDRNDMPFGLQIIGPRGRDVFTLGAAAAIEAALAANGFNGDVDRSALAEALAQARE